MKPIKFLRSLKYRNVDNEFYLDNCPIQKIGESMQEFTGGDVEDFSKVGRATFITLLKLGLTPDSEVLDVGAGCFRVGFWLDNFCDYYAIEPNRQMVKIGDMGYIDGCGSR